MTKNELFVNGELVLRRKDTHGKCKQAQNLPIFHSRVEKYEYYKSKNQFDIRNVLDIRGFLNEIRKDWNTYVSQVQKWIQANPVKKLVVTGIFTVMLGFVSSVAEAACLEEYTYQIQTGEKIQDIAVKHGVTPQEILDANGAFIEGKKILLPKVQDRIVTATILNVRSHPDVKSSIIGKYKKGDVVKVAFVENGWAGILINGLVCFVHNDYLTVKQSAVSGTTQTANTQVKTMYVTATTLRVRQSPSTNSPVLGLLKSNNRVTVTSVSNGWAKINFNGKIAFVSSSYLTNNQLIVPNNETVTNNSTASRSSVYVIKKGDTYTKIGKALGISVSTIQTLNPTVNPLKLKVGQQIKIPEAKAETDTQIKVSGKIAGVDPQGTFRFITSDGRTYAAKATGNTINELFNCKGEQVTLTLEGKRGQQLTLLSMEN